MGGVIPVACTRNDGLSAAGAAVGAKIGVSGVDRGAAMKLGDEIGAEGAEGAKYGVG